MPSIPSALQVGIPSDASDAPRDAVVRLQSSIMWLRTLSIMLVTKAERHSLALTKTKKDPKYQEAAERLGIDADECLAIIDRLLAALEEPKPPATKKKRAVK